MEIFYGSGCVCCDGDRRFGDPEQGSAVALGFFDGVHKGHRALLFRLSGLARERGLTSAVYTFVNHPMTVLGKKVSLLTSNRKKAEYIASEGIDRLCFDWFDKDFAGMSPEEFVKQILSGKFRAKIVAAGENYTFGSKGRGDARCLRELGEKYGFETVILPPVKCEIRGREAAVSSSLLRKLASGGKMRDYYRVASEPFLIEGTVVHGREVGRTMGFPTANIIPGPSALLPSFGVYATLTGISGEPGRKFESITNVGVKPTFGGDTVTVETNLKEFDGNLYGRDITVEFIEKIRGEKTFSSPEELRKQIASDAKKRRRIECLL